MTKDELAVYRYDGPDETNRETVIDDDTALWMARMCIGEGGLKCSADKASAMLWSLMNRWMLWDRKSRYPTYKSLMRAFSQPINPRWAEGGDLAKRYEGTQFASPEKLRRRERISSYKWDEVPLLIRSCVEDFRRGKLFPPDVLTTIEKARISNWASLASTPTKFPWGVDIDGDWFFEDRGLRDGVVIVDRVKP